MALSRDEAIQRACSIVSLAYQTIGDFSHASDGFCSQCPASQQGEWHFQNQGIALDYVERAVIEKLERDGYTARQRLHEYASDLAMLILQSDAYKDPDIRDLVDHILDMTVLKDRPVKDE